MTTTGWFTSNKTAEHEIYLPGINEVVDRRLEELKTRKREQLAAEGVDTEAIDEQLEQLENDDAVRAELDGIRRDMTATVKLRPLNAGDIAAINELKVSRQGASIALGEVKLLAVEMALVEWSIGQPITKDTIAQLNPLVFEQIHDLVDVGGDNPPTAPAASAGTTS